MRPLPVLTLTLAMLLWSSSFIALKHVLEIWSFGQVLFMRMGWRPVAGCSATASLAASPYQKGIGAGWPDGGAWALPLLSSGKSTPCVTPVPARPVWSVPCFP